MSENKLFPVFPEYNRVLMIPEFKDDEPELISGRGEHSRYARALKRKVIYVHETIDSPGTRYKAEWLEKMQGKEAAGFSKIPLSGNKKNYRIILCYLQLNGKEHAILLHSFREKTDKSYRKAILVARKRYNSLIEEVK